MADEEHASSIATYADLKPISDREAQSRSLGRAQVAARRAENKLNAAMRRPKAKKNDLAHDPPSTPFDRATLARLLTYYGDVLVTEEDTEHFTSIVISYLRAEAGSEKRWRKVRRALQLQRRAASALREELDVRNMRRVDGRDRRDRSAQCILGL